MSPCCAKRLKDKISDQSKIKNYGIVCLKDCKFVSSMHKCLDNTSIGITRRFKLINHQSN